MCIQVNKTLYYTPLPLLTYCCVNNALNFVWFVFVRQIWNRAKSPHTLQLLGVNLGKVGPLLRSLLHHLSQPATM